MAAVDDAPGRAGFSLASVWNDSRYRSVLFQFLTLVVLFSVIGFLLGNAVDNLARLGKTFGFDFLALPASYDINQTLIPYTSQDTHARAALVGILNTLLVAVVGCIAATVLGFLLGIARLSSNWLVNRLAYSYVEFTRNVPLLLHILFWHGIVINVAPSTRELLAAGVEGSFFLTNRGFIMPKPIFEPRFWVVGAAVVAGLLGAWGFRWWARARQAETGAIYPVLWVGLVIVFGLPVVAFLAAGSPLDFEHPEPSRFNFRGGLSITPEFFALTFALAIYTAAFIAEIVRAGIQAISRGQWEAAGALGLRRGRVLQLVVIPQALRVIVPPLTSQYLNLTKNSSLAIAIGYMDVVATLGGITLMQTGKEMETNILLMAFYLSLSLLISGAMNIYNKAIALKER